MGDKEMKARSATVDAECRQMEDEAIAKKVECIRVSHTSMQDEFGIIADRRRALQEQRRVRVQSICEEKLKLESEIKADMQEYELLLRKQEEAMQKARHEQNLGFAQMR